jgi:hypothetical protein
MTLLQQKEEDMKSLQEEISTLEEVRYGSHNTAVEIFIASC